MTEPNTDLADIRQKWLKFCPVHDHLRVDLPCCCVFEDHRPVIAALVGEVETLRAERDQLRSDLDAATQDVLAAEMHNDETCSAVADRDAMRVVVEAAKTYVENWHKLDRYRTGDNLENLADAQYNARSALIDAVDQMATPTALVPSVAAQDGEVVAQDPTEAPRLAQGEPIPPGGIYLVGEPVDDRPPYSWTHPCGWSQISPIPHLCPQCGTNEPWS